MKTGLFGPRFSIGRGAIYRDFTMSVTRLALISMTSIGNYSLTIQPDAEGLLWEYDVQPVSVHSLSRLSWRTGIVTALPA